MLESIHVKNIALIDEVEINLTNGLNVLSGETGAGKSIIIDAVNFALGKRMPKDIVRNEDEYALCELVFTADENARRLLLDEMIPVEDNRIIMQRKIFNGRNVCKVNGENVTTAFLKSLSELLIDIHGQHEHQSLLYKKKHMEILDSYCGSDFLNSLEENKKEYTCYLKLKKELEDATKDDRDRAKEISLAEFELNEIEEANLTIGEDEDLETDYRRMLNAKRIMDAVVSAHVYAGYESDEGAGTNIGRALSQLKMVSDYDEGLEDLLSQITDIDSLLNEFNRALADYREQLVFTEEEFVTTEERLNQINHLKAKYGKTIEDILEYARLQEDVLNKYSDYDSYLAELEKKVNASEAKILKNCLEMSKVRKKQSKVLAKEIGDVLKELNFPDVNFEISILSDEGNFSADGFDDIEFMISMNPGEKLKSLINVASGGELSRIMLALKAVLAKKDEIGTLIFDEIDTGISGRTAQKVSQKLAYISKLHQVICVTHLPQIASMADSHYEISKSVENAHTRTSIRRLDENMTVNELARMLGGAEITDTVISNAAEMKKMAEVFKGGL